MGRRKVEVAYRSDKAKRRKTFEDRKAGLFKKASEISALCGCKISLRIESEDGEVFEFGEDSNSANSANDGALVSTSFAPAHNDNGSQQQVPNDEILSPQGSLEHVFPQIPWNDPFLKMERDKDHTHYAVGPSSIDLDSNFFNQMDSWQEMLFPDIDDNLTSGWICSSQDAF